MVQPLWNTVWRFLKKNKKQIELLYDSTTPLVGIYQTELIQKDACTPVFIAVLFTITKIRKQFKCSSTNT